MSDVGKEEVRTTGEAGEMHVHITQWVDQNNPTGPMMFRAEMYPVPFEVGDRIMKEVADLMMRRLEESGYVNGDWKSERSGEAPSSEVLQ